MADRTWGEFRLAPRRATSLPRVNKRDYVSYKTLVRWGFACALRGSARGFWFIDPLGLRPRGLRTVANRACHVNHAPPSYNYNIHNGQSSTTTFNSMHTYAWSCITGNSVQSLTYTHVVHVHTSFNIVPVTTFATAIRLNMHLFS